MNKISTKAAFCLICDLALLFKEQYFPVTLWFLGLCHIVSTMVIWIRVDKGEQTK